MFCANAKICSKNLARVIITRELYKALVFGKAQPQPHSKIQTDRGFRKSRTRRHTQNPQSNCAAKNTANTAVTASKIHKTITPAKNTASTIILAKKLTLPYSPIRQSKNRNCFYPMPSSARKAYLAQNRRLGIIPLLSSAAFADKHTSAERLKVRLASSSDAILLPHPPPDPHTALQTAPRPASFRPLAAFASRTPFIPHTPHPSNCVPPFQSTCGVSSRLPPAHLNGKAPGSRGIHIDRQAFLHRFKHN